MIDHTKTIEALTLELDKILSGSRAFRKVILECVVFLTDERWGTINYMEGSQIYADRDRLLHSIREALSTITTGEDNDRT